MKGQADSRVGDVLWRAMGAFEVLAFTSAQLALAFRQGEYVIEGHR